MKYLKLFEAFEAKNITSTLRYLNDKSKKYFLKILKDLSKNRDLPIDKISDDYLTYSKIGNIEKDLKIDDSFPENKTESIFFLFDIEGNLVSAFENKKTEDINTILLNYVKMNQNVLSIDVDTTKGKLFPLDPDSMYKDILKQGDLVFGFLASPFSTGNLRNYSTYKNLFGLSYIVKADYEIYAIQNFRRGSKPSIDFQNFGSYGWVLTDGRYNSGDNFCLMKFIPGPDPLYIVDNGNLPKIDEDITTLYGSNYKEGLKKSNFYIKFDYDRFINDFETTEKKKEFREYSKKEIVKKNIQERLFDLILKNSKLEEITGENITDDELYIGNLKSLIINSIGYDFSLPFIWHERDYLNEIITFLKTLQSNLERGETVSQESLTKNLNKIKKRFFYNKQSIQKFKDNSDKYEKWFDDIKTKTNVDILQEILNVGLVLKNKIENTEISTLSDLIILNDKLTLLKSFINNSLKTNPVKYSGLAMTFFLMTEPGAWSPEQIKEEQPVFVDNLKEILKKIEGFINKKF